MRTLADLRHFGDPSSHPERDLTHAWVAVALIPVFLIVGFAVGEGLVSALGYPVGSSNPLWVSLVSDAGVLATVIAPCAAAAVFAQRARQAGLHRALTPFVIATVLGGGAVLMTVISEVGNYV